MKTTNRHLTYVTMTMGALILAVATATPAPAKSGPALTIQAVAVRGNEVAITVANPTARTQTGTVRSRAFTIRAMAGLLGQVSRFVLPEALLVIPRGVVVDDGVPF